MYMKIAFASDAAYPWFNGGMEKRRYIIAKELSESGHEVHIFTMYREGMISREFRSEGIIYHCTGTALPAKKMYKNGRRNMIWPLKYAFALPFKLFKYKFDFIDTEAFPFLHLPVLRLYSALHKVPFICTWHEVWGKEYWKKYAGFAAGAIGYFIEKSSMKGIKKRIAVSLSTIDEAIRLFGIAKEDIVLLHSAISDKEIEKAAAEAKKLKNQFVIVGRAIPEKRLDLAMRLISYVESDLIIVTSHDAINELKDAARQLGVAEKVHFESGLSNEKLFAIIAGSKALFMLSKREGLSLNTIEALALGTPVVALDSTMLPEEVKRYCTIIKESDMRAGMVDFVKSYEKIKLTASNNLSTVIKEFGSTAVHDAYGTVLGKKI